MGVALSFQTRRVMRHQTTESVPTVSGQVAGVKAWSLLENITHQHKPLKETAEQGWAQTAQNL